MPIQNHAPEQREAERVSATTPDPSADAKKILNAIKKLTCPAHNSVWLGPFDQLVGGGYALLAATQHGIHRRDLDHYNTRVQKKIVSCLESFSLSNFQLDTKGLGDWFSGFYFKSAIQRLVWAAERLLLTCASVNCPCGHRKTEQPVIDERPRWPQVLDGALQRLDHVQNDHGKYLSKCRAVREQFILRDNSGKAREYRRDDPLDHNKALAMLRYDVNNRKHRIYIRSKLRDQMSAGKGDSKKWCSSGADFQFALAVEVFGLVSEAYEELRIWAPTPELSR
jgi:hypothetical protein